MLQYLIFRPFTLIARHNVRKYLERIKSRFPHLEKLELNKLSSIDEYVFRLPDGSQPRDLHGGFEKVLKDTNLLVNTENDTF